MVKSGGDVAGAIVPSVNRYGVVEDLEGFAEAVGLTVSAVSKIEIGDRIPSIDTFVLLSDFFGVSLDYLVLGKEH